MRKKLVRYIFFSLCMCLLLSTGHSQAADANVKVTLPNFTVNLNGHIVENQYREYPLLVYNDITYVPMTWYDSRFLGLEANWSPENGLIINKGSVTSSYVPYESEYCNLTTYTAKIHASTITVNGNSIDNSKEEYPLLNFRDVTYFPLTWRFAHDEFGWEYNWDNTKGLHIKSHNLQLQTVGLPEYAGENDIAFFKGFYYFVETTDTMNYIYRTPENQLSDKEEIYSYSTVLSTDSPKSLYFEIRDNTLWIVYQVGRGVMGSIKYVKIGDDGKIEELKSRHRYFDFRDTQYGTLFINYFDPEPPEGSMYLQQGDNLESIGDPDLMTYAYHVSNHYNTLTTIIDDNVYVLSSPNPLTEPNNIYKVDLKTNKTEKIVNSNVIWFRIINNKLYYIKSQDKALYLSALDGMGEIKLSESDVSWFDSIDGNVFYTSKIGAYQFELYKVNPKGEDSLILTTPIADVKVVNDNIICQIGEKDEYRLILLDSSGHLLLEVGDPIYRVYTSDDGILIQTSKDSLVKTIH